MKYSRPGRSGGVQAELVVDGIYTNDATVVQVRYEESFIGFGSSKREPGDKFSLEAGIGLALARACEDLAHQLREHASQYITVSEEEGSDES